MYTDLNLVSIVAAVGVAFAGASSGDAAGDAGVLEAEVAAHRGEPLAGLLHTAYCVLRTENIFVSV